MFFPFCLLVKNITGKILKCGQKFNKLKGDHIMGEVHGTPMTLGQASLNQIVLLHLLQKQSNNQTDR